jgi:hypothetical protein
MHSRAGPVTLLGAFQADHDTLLKRAVSLGRLPLRLGHCDRLRRGGLGLPEVFQPLRNSAHHASNLRRPLVSRGGSVLRSPRPPAGFLGGGPCNANRFLESVPLAFRPAGSFSLRGKFAGQLPCPGFRGFSPLVQFGHQSDDFVGDRAPPVSLAVGGSASPSVPPRMASRSAGGTSTWAALGGSLSILCRQRPMRTFRRALASAARNEMPSSSARAR